MGNENNAKGYLIAKKKVMLIRTFYISLISFVICISLLAAMNYYFNQWQYPWFLWAGFGWGIGLLVQAYKIYGSDKFFGKSWEQKKLKNLMENQPETKSNPNSISKNQYAQRGNIEYRNAKRKVEILKGFYSHTLFFIVINLLIIFYFSKVNEAGEIDFSYWGNYLTLFLWGIGLVSHGIYVLFVFKFKNGRLRRWEEKKINEILEKDYL